MKFRKGKSQEKLYFAPGCALMLYKPELAATVHEQLKTMFGKVELLLTCCQHDPGVQENSRIINICPGCDKRFRNDYANVSTISLWEVLAENKSFIFPVYKSRMSILDACPTRERSDMHDAIRILLAKMEIELIEPKNTRTRSVCCGDSFYGLIPVDEVKAFMLKRASEMPVGDVVVYCISCIKAIHNGGKNPRYLVDLLFGESTLTEKSDPDIWHSELKSYIEQH